MCAAGQGVRLSITQTVPTALSAVGITHWCPLAGAPPRDDSTPTLWG